MGKHSEHLCKYSMCIGDEHPDKGQLKVRFWLFFKAEGVIVNVLAYGIQNVEFRESKSFIYAPHHLFDYNSTMYIR